MSAATGAAAGAAVAAAAAEQHRRHCQEEEELTAYTPRDLADDWEFKILRSNTRSFRDPAQLQEILNEEARAGWVLLEKFDDHRIRLKRPASARERDGKLNFDPYRTLVGPQYDPAAWKVAGLVLAVTAVLFVFLSLVAFFLN